MNNKFWAHIVSIIVTVITVLLIWFIYGKPIITDNATQMIFCLAIIALYNTTLDYMSRKKE